jgi:RimJ/RimL family protein N-acetyltransferase
MKNPFLTGARVYLRALERADAPVILPWVNDPAVIHQLLIHRPMNLAEEEAFIDAVNRSAADVVFGICQREPDHLIGVAGLHRVDQKNRHAMFGIFIGEADARGCGFGTEATLLVVRYGFETANLNRVWLQVYEDNPGAIHVYEKLGFSREGLLRQDTFRRGRYGNTVVMGLLRADWKRKKERKTT